MLSKILWFVSGEQMKAKHWGKKYLLLIWETLTNHYILQ